MQTIHRSETRSVSIAASPDAVLDVVADAENLPRWAPNFASRVRPGDDDGRWLVDNGEAEFAIALRVDREHGTVDILDPSDPNRGAFTRVVPNAAGSEYLFTLFFPDGTPAEAIDAQMRTVETELETVRALAEAA
jgi:hypothetical protein